jgi:hypothetical protein
VVPLGALARPQEEVGAQVAAAACRDARPASEAGLSQTWGAGRPP